MMFIDSEKAYDSVKREVLCSILTEFVIIMKLFRLIKTCLNVTCNRVSIDKHLSDAFSIQNSQKPGGALSPLLFILALEYAIRKVQKNKELKIYKTIILPVVLYEREYMGKNIDCV
jgi:hypothetical protein